jgi:basic membrane lipoprotein Med (substrate-binding protein (PBP1-ABC) superfamily)
LRHICLLGALFAALAGCGGSADAADCVVKVFFDVGSSTTSRRNGPASSA